jgi:hypothetical protein
MVVTRAIIYCILSAICRHAASLEYILIMASASGSLKPKPLAKHPAYVRGNANR